MSQQWRVVIIGVGFGGLSAARHLNSNLVDAALWGLSMALREGTELVNGQPKDTNLNSNPVLRMSDVPEVEVEFLPSTEVPTGLGEPATTPVVPAIANAIFAACGARVRHLPIRPQAVLDALAHQT